MTENVDQKETLPGTTPSWVAYAILAMLLLMAVWLMLPAFAALLGLAPWSEVPGLLYERIGPYSPPLPKVL